jgi:hypothetical protein
MQVELWPRHPPNALATAHHVEDAGSSSNEDTAQHQATPQLIDATNEMMI